MRGRLRSRATLLALLLAACADPAPEPPKPRHPKPATSAASPSRVPSLPSGPAEPWPHTPRERELAGGEVHAYEIEVEAGDYLRAVVDQRGVDVAIQVLDPAGSSVFSCDATLPDGAWGPEPVHWVAATGGRHRLLVKAWDDGAPGGLYEIRSEDLRPATAEDRTRAAAARLFHRAEDLRFSGDPSRASDALGLYAQAGRLYRSLGDAYEGALCDYAQGLIWTQKESWRRVRRHFAQALPHLLEASDVWRGLRSLHHLGHAHTELGDMEPVVGYYRRALHWERQTGDVAAEATTLHNLAYAFQSMGELQEALETYADALPLWDRLGDLENRATNLHNQGRLFARLGRFDEAREDFEAAVEIRRRLELTRDLAVSLDTLGRLHTTLGEPRTALRYLQAARRLRTRAGDRRGLAITLRSLGTAFRRLGDPHRAEEHFQASLQILDTLDEPRQRARLRRETAFLLLDLDRPEEAVAQLEPALEHFRFARDVHGEMDVLAGLARASRRLGRPREARRYSEAVLERIETVQAEPATFLLHASYLATQREHCDFHLDLLVDQGDAAGAFATAERCRARALLTLLQDREPATTGPAESNDLEARERQLRRRIRGLETHRLDLLDQGTAEGRPADPVRLARLRDEVETLLRTHQTVQARLEARRSAESSVLAADVLDLTAVQERLLDSDTVLLSYRLGTRRSFLWAVTDRSFEVFELPARDVLEDDVRTIHELLARGPRRDARGRIHLLLERLGATLLEPASELLAGRRRLVVVADGVLPLLPFAALELGGRALIESHEISSAPSASTLAKLRTRETPSFRHTLAVVADPVFSRQDPRLQGNAAVAADARTLRGGPLDRLPQTRQEAERILARVEPSRAYRALGFAARRELVTGGVLSGSRILHLATHARIDSERPELSHLVFSRFDEKGRPLEGFLFAHELFGLELVTDLVVLSACDTALGPQVAGEGLVGLSQGFLDAGAARVLATHWPVEDEATAALMDRFYEALLTDGLPPAAALRRAQIELKQEPRWGAPYFWAGFSVTG